MEKGNLILLGMGKWIRHGITPLLKKNLPRLMENPNFGAPNETARFGASTLKMEIKIHMLSGKSAFSCFFSILLRMLFAFFFFAESTPPIITTHAPIHSPPQITRNYVYGKIHRWESFFHPKKWDLPLAQNSWLFILSHHNMHPSLGKPGLLLPSQRCILSPSCIWSIIGEKISSALLRLHIADKPIWKQKSSIPKKYSLNMHHNSITAIATFW